MDKLTYTFRYEDIVDFRKYQIKIPRIKKIFFKNMLSLTIMLAFVFVIFILFVISLINAFDFGSLIVGIIFLFLFILLWFYCFWQMNLRVPSKKEFSKQRKLLQKDETEKIEITINDNGFTLCTDTSETLYKWNTIVDVHDTGKSLLVYIDTISAIIVPYRAFEHKDNIQNFVNFINSKIIK